MYTVRTVVHTYMQKKYRMNKKNVDEIDNMNDEWNDNGRE